MKVVWKIVHIIGWLLVIGWVSVIAFDYFQVSNKKPPQLCIKEEVKEYSDGNMKICTGLGYKVYRNGRASVRVEYLFGPFWTKEPTPNP